MINVLTIVLLILCLYRIKFYKRNTYNKNCLSKQQGQCLRGLTAYVLVLHHLSINMCDYEDVFYHCYAYIGILCVSVFFFFSGYGLVISFRDSTNYLNGFLKKRYLAIFIPYVIVATMYWVWSALMHNPYSILYMLYSYFSGFPFVENSWYVIVIALYYLVFWSLAKIDKSSNQRIILAGTVIFGIAWILFCQWRGWGNWWYISCFAIAVGIIVGIYESQWKSSFESHYLVWLVTVLVSFVGVWTCYIMQSKQIAGMIASTILPLLLVLILMKVSIDNIVLKKLGTISYEVYLVHGFFIKILRGDDWYITSDVLYIICVLVCTYICSWVIYKGKQLIVKKKVSI